MAEKGCRQRRGFRLPPAEGFQPAAWGGGGLSGAQRHTIITSVMKFWKKLTLNEKAMIGLIIALLLSIIFRWEYVSTQVSEAFRGLFSE